jgi:hypothetical protein
VRFSVWRETERSTSAEAAVSLDDEEAARLAHFLAGTAPRPRQPGLLERVYSRLAR